MKRSTVLTALGAAAVASATPLRARAADTVRFATIPIDTGAQVYFADSQKMFAKAGLDAHVQSIPNGSAITAAVLGGSVDVGFSNILSLATAHEKGVPVTLIAPAGLYLSKAPTSVLMVPKDSPATDARSLNGKTVAVNGLRNITQLAVLAWSDKNGGDSKTLKFVEMPFTDMPLALASHRVDAALIAEPAVTEAKANARLFGKPYDAIASDFLIAGWFTSKSWAAAHPDLVKKVAAVIRESGAWANKNGAASADVLASATKLDAATLKSMVRSVYAEKLDPGSIQPLIDLAARYGILKAGFPAQDLIDKNALG
ncbi:MAG TPA: ABC transporter substrate-binding protein [Candidatus Elarobacter sp.]|jgi:NitT/TauT family transport system substrate-binding protein|nr:ABC transporter substrate-binding protein [Candidatus Elarobacter sp.]